MHFRTAAAQWAPCPPSRAPQAAAGGAIQVLLGPFAAADHVQQKIPFASGAAPAAAAAGGAAAGRLHRLATAPVGWRVQNSAAAAGAAGGVAAEKVPQAADGAAAEKAPKAAAAAEELQQAAAAGIMEDQQPAAAAVDAAVEVMQQQTRQGLCQLPAASAPAAGTSQLPAAGAAGV